MQYEKMACSGGFGVGITSRYELKEVSSIPIESTGSKATKVLERGVFDAAPLFELCEHAVHVGLGDG